MRAWVEVDASTKDGSVSVLLDGDDYLRLRGRCLSIGSHGYAQMFDQGRVQVVHRWVLGLQVGDQMIGDHRNGDRLDNRRSNLRVVNPSGSSQNVAGRGASRHRGVYPTRNGRWIAQVKFRGQIHRLGIYACEEEAARVADTKRRELMPFYVPASERASQSPTTERSNQ